MRRTRVGAVLLGVLAACGPPAGPDPDQGRCDTPAATASVTELELGAGTDGAFRPFMDGEVVELVTGGQGLRMLGLRVRARGASVPACFDLELRELPGGFGEEPLATMRSGIAMTGSDTERVSDTAFFILDYVCTGSPFRLRGLGYGATAEHTLFAGGSDGIQIVALRPARPSYRVGDLVDLELETTRPTERYGIELFVDGRPTSTAPTGTSTAVAHVTFVASSAGTLSIDVAVACQRAHLDLLIVP